MKTSVTALPFNSFLGIQISTESSQLLRLPSGEKYLNHLGTVHASAQLALAEASSGEFLLRHFGSTHGILPVVRRLEAKFRKPANGAVTSMASAAPESLAHLDDELASKGRSLIPITVELHDESGRGRAIRFAPLVQNVYWLSGEPLPSALANNSTMCLGLTFVKSLI